MEANDPVCYYETPPYGGDGSEECGWGFWTETWDYFFGGYASEAEARAALRKYCECLNSSKEN